jgi:predicted amidohydrolase YtcJ
MELLADTVFLASTVLTVDSENQVAETVAVRDGRVLTIGATRYW